MQGLCWRPSQAGDFRLADLRLVTRIYRQSPWPPSLLSVTFWPASGPHVVSHGPDGGLLPSRHQATALA
jgi:hypothetical protein